MNWQNSLYFLKIIYEMCKIYFNGFLKKILLIKDILKIKKVNQNIVAFAICFKIFKFVLYLFGLLFICLNIFEILFYLK